MSGVTVAGSAGFCFGVRRAVDLAEREAAAHKEIYSYGEIIHNTHETNRLAGLGVRAIWNFTNQDLHLSDPNVLVESIRFSDSLLALSYYMKQQAASDDRKLEEPH